MKTSLEHLPDYKQRQLKEITEIIVKAVDPEKVILFGSHSRKDLRGKDRFVRPGGKRRIGPPALYQKGF